MYSYYKFFSGKNKKSVIVSSLYNMIFYHLGSVALGSLLIIMFKIPRLILTTCRFKYNIYLFLINIYIGYYIF